MAVNNVKDLYDTLCNLEVFKNIKSDVYGDHSTNDINIFGDVDVTIIYKPFDFDGIRADNKLYAMVSTFKVEVICRFPDVSWVPGFINELNAGGLRSCTFDNTFSEQQVKHYIFNINYLGGK